MASDRPLKSLTPSAASEDMVLPFQVESTGVRGRYVRLGDTVDTILGRHDYPAPVSELLGEALLVAALLGSALKTDGGLILQIHSDNGPVSLLVASYAAPGGLRGYAMADRERVEALAAELGRPLEQRDLLGEGRFAITIDPGAGLHRYQGIVALSPAGLAASIHDYFRQSEQIATRLVLAVGQRLVPGARNEGARWRAGGILIQHMAVEGGAADEEERQARALAAATVYTEGGEPVEEAWNRVTLLLDTTEAHELLDPLVAPERLLLRLFHEDGVRVYDKASLTLDCRCTPDRLQGILNRYVNEDRADLVEDGAISMRCEFCNKTFRFDPDTLASMDDADTAKG